MFSSALVTVEHSLAALQVLFSDPPVLWKTLQSWARFLVALGLQLCVSLLFMLEQVSGNWLTYCTIFKFLEQLSLVKVCRYEDLEDQTLSLRAQMSAFSA